MNFSSWYIFVSFLAGSWLALSIGRQGGDCFEGRAGRYPGDVFGQAGRERLSVSAKGHLPTLEIPVRAFRPRED